MATTYTQGDVLAQNSSSKGYLDASLQNPNSPDSNCINPCQYKLKTYSVATSLTFICTFGAAGILFHVGTLLAFKLKKSTHKLYYGLNISLSVVDFAFCIIWLLSDIVYTTANHLGLSLPYQFCYLHGAIYAIGSSTVLVGITFLAIQKICMLKKYKTCVIHLVVCTGIAAKIVLPILFTLAFTVDYGLVVPYKICVLNCSCSQRDNSPNLPIYMIIGVTSLFLFLLIIAALLATHLWILACSLRKQTMALHHKRHSLQKLTVDSSEFVESNQDSLVSGSSHKGDCTTTSRPRVAFMQKGLKSDDDDEDVNGDTIDQQMRMRAISGRRHTVANIGDTPMRGMHRGSFSDITSGRPSSNYGYVRKWSVDITALQDQLENPKIHDPNFPFKDLSVIKDHANGDQNATNQDNKKNEGKGCNTSKTDGITKRVNIQQCHDVIQVLPVTPTSVVTDNTNKVDMTETDEDTELDRRRQCLVSNRRQLNTGIACLCLVLTTAMGFLPVYIFILVANWLDASLSVNMTRILTSVSMFPLVLHPLFMSCMEQKIYQALERLKYTLTHCQCVCYCNLLPEKKQPPVETTESLMQA